MYSYGILSICGCNIFQFQIDIIKEILQNVRKNYRDASIHNDCQVGLIKLLFVEKYVQMTWSAAKEFSKDSFDFAIGQHCILHSDIDIR